MSIDDPNEYEMVMPFVVCASQGGPYEDQAFVAGAQFGQIHAEAKDIGPGRRKSWYAERALVPQLDLLAMHLGQTIETEPWDEYPGEWVLVTFSRPIRETV